MTNNKQIVNRPTHQQVQYRQTTSLTVRRITKSRKAKAFVNNILDATAIICIISVGFLGIGAVGSWGLEIIEANAQPIILSQHNWQSQKSICLGGILVACSGFLGSVMLRGYLALADDE